MDYFFGQLLLLCLTKLGALATEKEILLIVKASEKHPKLLLRKKKKRYKSQSFKHISAIYCYSKHIKNLPKAIWLLAYIYMFRNYIYLIKIYLFKKHSWVFVFLQKFKINIGN